MQPRGPLPALRRGGHGLAEEVPKGDVGRAVVCDPVAAQVGRVAHQAATSGHAARAQKDLECDPWQTLACYNSDNGKDCMR